MVSLTGGECDSTPHQLSKVRNYAAFVESKSSFYRTAPFSRSQFSQGLETEIVNYRTDSFLSKPQQSLKLVGFSSCVSFPHTPSPLAKGHKKTAPRRKVLSTSRLSGRGDRIVSPLRGPSLRASLSPDGRVEPASQVLILPRHKKSRLKAAFNWSARLDGDANLSKSTLHPARYRSGWQCGKRKFAINQFTCNCLEKLSACFQ